MGQRLSRKEKAEEGGDECVQEVNPRTPVTRTDHKVEVPPRPDEKPLDIGEGGGGQEKGRGKTKKKEVLEVCLLFLLFFSSTRAHDEQVEEDQTSLQDIVCTVDDNDQQEPPSSSPEVYASAEDQQMEDDEPEDQDSPASPSAGASVSHLLRQLDCNEITRIKDHICWKYAIGKKMGEGGFGSVFEGTRCKDGLPVAMKFVAKTENVPYIYLISRLRSLCHLPSVTVGHL